MNILVIGCGVREHAIIAKLHESPGKHSIFCVGDYRNPAIASIVDDYLITSNINSVIEFAKRLNVTFAIIGPERYLEQGWTDALLAADVHVVGPTKSCAQIETSKAYARTLLDSDEYLAKFQPKFTIVTKGADAEFAVQKALEKYNENVVIKPDGLAAGKGVKVFGEHLHNVQEAYDYAMELLEEFNCVVIEEKLYGQEFSLMSLLDCSSTFVHFPVIRDFKRLNNSDVGPNTGGMGCIAQADGLLPGILSEDVDLSRTLNELTVAAINKFNTRGYSGVLYGSYIKTETGIRIIEYNARFGDPEIVCALQLLDCDFANLCYSVADSCLSHFVENVKFHKKHSICKYIVPPEYALNTSSATNSSLPFKPSSPLTPLSLPSNSKNVTIFYGAVEANESTHESTANVDASTGITGMTGMTGMNIVFVKMRGSRIAAFVSTNANRHKCERFVEKRIAKVAGNFHHRSDIGKCPAIKQCKLCLGNRVMKRKKPKRTHKQFLAHQPEVIVLQPKTTLAGPTKSGTATTKNASNVLNVSSVYTNAGVNIDEGELSVTKFRNSVMKTYTSAVKSRFGDFSGIMAVDKPCYLVFSTDGVGTKPEVVIGHLGLRGYYSLGFDITNHCINDTLVKGASPFAFLDFYGSGVLDSNHVATLVEGISDACAAAGCVLIGGETAEMSSVYSPGSCEIVGTMIGTVQPDSVIEGKNNISPGHIVMCLRSNGPHTNGYTLIRKVLELKPELRNDKEFMDAICQPHRSYLNEIRKIQATSVKIDGLVHITGGGIIGNVPRVLPDHCDVEWNWEIYNWPTLYHTIQTVASVSDSEMLRVFNCGMGMLVIVPEFNETGQSSEQVLREMFGSDITKVGTVVQK